MKTRKVSWTFAFGILILMGIAINFVTLTIASLDNNLKIIGAIGLAITSLGAWLCGYYYDETY